MIRTVPTTVVAALLGWSLVHGAPAQAAFSRLTSASATHSSAVLQPPASVSATCAAAGPTSTGTVSWTASPSTFLTGYRITSTPASTTQNVAATARTATMTGLTKGLSYTFTVVATYRNWTSATRTTASTMC